MAERMDEFLSEKVAKGDEMRFRAGYLIKNQYDSNGERVSNPSWNHKPCGTAVWDPQAHDWLCPANGRGRTEPMLDGSPPPSPEPATDFIK